MTSKILHGLLGRQQLAQHRLDELENGLDLGEELVVRVGLGEGSDEQEDRHGRAENDEDEVAREDEIGENRIHEITSHAGDFSLGALVSASEAAWKRAEEARVQRLKDTGLPEAEDPPRS